MMQNIWFFAPIVLSAICIPIIFRRAGFPRHVVRLMWLPAIMTVSSFLAVLAGERSLLGGPLGIWAIAAGLPALVVVDWPESKSGE